MTRCRRRLVVTHIPSFYRRNSADGVPDGFLHCTHGGVSEIVMKPLSDQERLASLISTGKLTAVPDLPPISWGPAIEWGVRRPAEEITLLDRDSEDEKYDR